MSFRRYAATAATLAFLGAVLAPAAGADPEPPPKQASVRGTCTLGSHPGVPGARAEVKPLSGVTVRVHDAKGALVTEVKSDKEGKFTVPLAAGTYRISFIAPVEAPVSPEPADVELKEGETKELNAKFEVFLK